MAIPLRVTVAGVERQVRQGTLAFNRAVNKRSDASFMISDGDPVTIGAEVVIYRNDVAIYGGEVEHVTAEGPDHQCLDVSWMTVTAIDFGGLPDRRIVSASRPTETAKARLTWLVSEYLSALGVTLDGAQSDGETLSATAYDHVTATAILQDICRRNGLTPLVWTISATKVLLASDPATQPAPYDLTGTLAWLTGDVSVSPSRENYATKVIVKAGSSAVVEKTVSFTGDGVSDTFDLPYPIQGPIAFAEDGAVGNAVVVVDAGTESLGGLLSPSGYLWEYDPDDGAYGSIRRRAGAPSLSSAIAITYNVQFPIIRSAQAVGYAADPRDVLVAAQDCFDADEAAAIAASELAIRSGSIVYTLTYPTDQDGLVPGMTQDVDLSERGASESPTLQAIITEVRTTQQAHEPETLRYAITAITSADYRTWQDYWSRLNGGVSSSAASVVGSTVVTQATSSGQVGGAPTQVQFNDDGVLGGDAGLTYNKTTNALTVSTVASVAGETLALSSTAPAQDTGATAGAPVTLSASHATTGSGAGTAAGGAVTITAGNASGQTSGNAAGGAVTITAGNSKRLSAGGIAAGAVTITAGTGAESTTTGGAITLTAGVGQAAAGGAVTIASGACGSGTSAGGAVSITSGIGGSAGSGVVTVASGDGSASAATSGAVTLKSGDAGSAGAVTIGVVTVKAGSGLSSGGTFSSNGGATNIQSGDGGTNGVGSNQPGSGGALSVAAGRGGHLSASGAAKAGTGGALSVSAGAGGNNTAGSSTRNGGDGGALTLSSGAAGTGATANGTVGAIIIKIGATEVARFDTDSALKLAAIFQQFTEMTAPASPATNDVRVYAQDNGAGKTQLMALFATGAAQQIAIEP